MDRRNWISMEMQSSASCSSFSPSGEQSTRCRTEKRLISPFRRNHCREAFRNRIELLWIDCAAKHVNETISGCMCTSVQPHFGHSDDKLQIQFERTRKWKLIIGRSHWSLDVYVLLLSLGRFLRADFVTARNGTRDDVRISIRLSSKILDRWTLPSTYSPTFGGTETANTVRVIN